MIVTAVRQYSVHMFPQTYDYYVSGSDHGIKYVYKNILNYLRAFGSQCSCVGVEQYYFIKHIITLKFFNDSIILEKSLMVYTDRT
jgi:hypothetical protein